MPNRDEQQHRSPRDVPPVGRPRGAIWRALQADGVVWEGQVQLVGDDHDLASRMIVTHRRVVFVRGGELVLDIPRDWLRPEPVLRRDGVLDLFVATPGGNLFDEPMKVPLRMREGHPAAGHIIAMLAPGGVRRIAADALSGMERAREAAPPARFGSFWDDDEPDAHITGNGFFSAPSAFDDDPDPAVNGVSAAAWPPIEPPDHVVRVSSSPRSRPTTNAFPITGLLPRDQRKSSWGLILRVGALALLLATAAALGAGKLNLRGPGGGSDAILAVPTPTVSVIASPAAAPDAARTTEEQPAISIGVGGVAARASVADATVTSEASGTATATSEPAESVTETEPAVAATEAVIPTPATTSAPDSVPTETPDPTPDIAAASGPATVATVPDPTSTSQPAAVAADEAPAQEIVVGPLRLAVLTALRAETLPRYALPPGTGEWVLLEIAMTNEGDAPASLAMGDFRLFDRGTGTVADLDTGTDVIAGLAGFDPARAVGDTIAVEPGEATETLLLYLLPPGSSDDVTLLVGQTSMDLAPALALGESVAAAAPELVTATVAEVLDGARFVADIDGLQETVQYLGIQAPAAGACFAAEATAANAQLLEGQQVWLERQATDRGADDVLPRDVWIAEPDGNRALVAARLLETGAGTAAAATPDTRYQAWFQAAAALARSNGAGLWGACPEV